LIYDVESDQLSRPLRQFRPRHDVLLSEHDASPTTVRPVTFTVYRDDIREVWSVPGYATGEPPAYGFETVGAVTITRKDAGGRVTEVIRAERECSCGALKSVEKFPQKRWKAWTRNFHDDWGRLLTQRVYHKIPLIGEGERGEHYGESKFSYDIEGRRIREVSPGGTITRAVYDATGRVVSRWVGTNDAGATPSDPTGNSAPGNNMVQTLSLEYDNGNSDGLGLLTKETRPVDGNASHDQVTAMAHDFRAFLESQTVSDGTTDFITQYTHNNVGQILQTNQYHTEIAAGNLTGRSEVTRDIAGRGFRSETYAVDPDTGTVGNALRGETWRDPNGKVIKQTSPGNEAFSVTKYDSLNRVSASYLCVSDGSSGSGNSEADSLVIEQSEIHYNRASQAITSVSYQRFHDATGTGPLKGPDGDQPRARRSYTARWYDGNGRTVASANIGTNGGMAWVRPATVPDRSDTVLVTSRRYAADGQANASLDAMGIETRWENDALSRQIVLIENYDPEAPDDDPSANRTTAFAYTADGQLKTLTLVNPITGDQVTRWIYGTTLEDSLIARADLLRAKIYPESNDESDPLGDGPQGEFERTEYTYNRQGVVVTLKDPNETVHAFDYDRLGRTRQDRIIALGTNLDDSVLRIETTYDTKRLLTASVTSYDDAMVGMGNVINEVGYTYDDFGQLIADQQSHDGEVDGSTPEVSYAYADGANANSARRTGMTYPDGRQIDFSYGASGGLDDLLSRIASFAINGESTDLVTYEFVGAGRYVKIAYPQPDVELSYFTAADQPVGDADDPYGGYDRFSRTIDMRWIDSSDGGVKDRIQYGYDMAGNRTWRKNLAATQGGQDFDYRYDGLYQVKESSLGTLNLNQTAIGGVPAADEQFAYDATGNWTKHTERESGTVTLDQSRKSNKDNQLTQVDGSSEGLSYDKVGNATKVVPTVDGDWDTSYALTWDAWNRLIEVKDDHAQTVAVYAYDGTFRRITKTVASDTTHFFYNDQWKCVEERINSEAAPKQQYIWGARPGHRDELVLRDRDTNHDGTLNERLYTAMEYFNPTSVMDASGEVQERYRFSAFGNRTVMAPDWSERTASSFAVEFGFQGQFRDAGTGWYDYGFRYYVPEQGRWASRDPIGEAGGINLYGFVGNGPTGKIDSLGLFAQLFVLGPVSKFLLSRGAVAAAALTETGTWFSPVPFGDAELVNTERFCDFEDERACSPPIECEKLCYYQCWDVQEFRSGRIVNGQKQRVTESVGCDETCPSAVEVQNR